MRVIGLLGIKSKKSVRFWFVLSAAADLKLFGNFQSPEVLFGKQDIWFIQGAGVTAVVLQVLDCSHWWVLQVGSTLFSERKLAQNTSESVGMVL